MTTAQMLASLALGVLLGCQPEAAVKTPMGTGVAPPQPMPPEVGGPLVSAARPSAWPSAGGVPLTLIGKRFAAGASVTIDGLSAGPVRVLSSAEAEVMLPARPGAFGPMPIVLTNLDGQASPPSSVFSYSAATLEFPNPILLTGYTPKGVTVADVNGDGKPDVVVANMGSDDIAVLLGDGQGGFTSARHFATPRGPRAVVVADFDQDRIADLAVACQVDNLVALLRADGRGGYLPPTIFKDIVSPGLYRPHALATGDLNRDGKPDLAVAVEGRDYIWVLLGDGNANFPTRTKVPAGGVSPLSVVLGDYDGDGDLDIAAALSGSDRVGVQLGDGMGGFVAGGTFSSGASGPAALANGDFDEDGRLDLVVGHLGAHSVRVLRGSGTGSFAAITTCCTVRGPVAELAVGDFNRDGHLDVIATNTLTFFTLESAVLLGDGTGAFAATRYLVAGQPTSGVASHDVNNDGNLDLLIGSESSDGVALLFGNGQAGFGALPAHPIGGSSFKLLSADLNGDGRLDLISADGSSSSVSVLLASGSGFAPARVHPTLAGTQSIAVADFNRDGTVDIAVSGRSGRLIYALLGDGAGNFAAATPVVVPWDPADLDAGDLNGDGAPDLLYVSDAFNQLGILHGDGQGGFITAGTITLEAPAYTVNLGDLNGDGLLDVALPLVATQRVVLLLGDGRGGLNPLPSLRTAFFPYTIEIADLNQDQAADLIAGSTAGVHVFYGDGHGRFETGPLLATDGQVVRVQARDINGDGFIDLALVQASAELRVLLGDGTGSFQSSGRFIFGQSLFGASYGYSVVGDFDGDRRPDVAIAANSPPQILILQNRSH